MKQVRTFYDILEVARNASNAEIKRAYRKRALELHPDQDQTPGAGERFKKLQQAYETLRDPTERASYDLRVVRAESVAAGSTPSDSGDAPVLEIIRCQSCGRIDATLRGAAFMYAMSFLLVTLRRGKGGIYCSSCRDHIALQLNAVTALLGWWGFPWGPIYTIQCWWTNLTGGRQEVEFNAVLLASLAVQTANDGRLALAIEAARQSLALDDNADVRQLLEELENHARRSGEAYDKRQTSNRPTPSRIIGAITVPAAVVLMTLLFSASEKGAVSDPASRPGIGAGMGSESRDDAIVKEVLQLRRRNLEARTDTLASMQAELHRLEGLASGDVTPQAVERHRSLADSFNSRVDGYNADLAAYNRDVEVFLKRHATH